MAKQVINVGQDPNDGTGDPIRTAWQKANLNFTELYDKFADFVLTDANISDGSAGQVLTTDGSGNFTFQNPSSAGIDAHLNTSTAANNEVLSWNGSDYDWVAPGISFGDLSVTVAAAANTSTLTYNAGTGAFIYVPQKMTDYALKTDLPTELTDLGISDGSNNQVLSTDGNGNFTFVDPASGSGGATTLGGLSDVTISSAANNDVLTWNGTAWVNSPAASGGGSSLQARTTVSATTASIADGAIGNIDIAGFKGYALFAITTNKAAWVRIYANGATRTADASRAETSDPAPDAGVIAEVITTGAETVLVTPGTIGFNFESTPINTIPCAVKNKSGATGTVQVTLSVLQLEA